MTDRSWMLNTKAIRTAKECINLVKDELQIKLPLSHPEFMEVLQSYVELTESESLSEAYARLASLAGIPNVPNDMKQYEQPNKKVVSITENQSTVPVSADAPTLEDEMIEYNGKLYQRWMDGMEFKGLYRGQARYV